MRMVFKVMEQDDITWRKLAGQKKENLKLHYNLKHEGGRARKDIGEGASS